MERLRQLDLHQLGASPQGDEDVQVAAAGTDGKRFEEAYAMPRAECDVCRVKYGIASAASSNCYDCGDNLCAYCASVHRSTSQTAHHRVVRIQVASYVAPTFKVTKGGAQHGGAGGGDNVDGAAADVAYGELGTVPFYDITTTCIPHGRRAEKWCTLCEEAVCDLCEFNHEGHRVEALTDMNRQLQATIVNLIKQTHTQKANIAKVQRFLGSQRKWIKDRRQDLIDDVTKRADQMRRAVDIIEMRFKDEIEAAAVKQFARVDADYERFSQLHTANSKAIVDGVFAIQHEPNPKKLGTVQTKLLHELRPNALTQAINPTDVTPPLNFYWRLTYSGDAEKEISDNFGALDNFSLLPVTAFNVSLADDLMPALPTAIAINDNQTILVADYRNGRVKLFGPAGESLGYAGQGSLSSAFGLAVLPDSRRFAVTDPKAGAIVLVQDSIGSTLRIPVTHGNALRGLCCTQNGTLYAAAPQTKSVLIFDASAKCEQGVRFRGEIATAKRTGKDQTSVGAPIEAGDSVFQRPTYLSSDQFGRLAISDWFASQVQVCLTFPFQFVVVQFLKLFFQLGNAD